MAAPLSPQKILQARRLRRRGFTWEAIAEQFGKTVYALRMSVDAEFSERITKQKALCHIQRKARAVGKKVQSHTSNLSVHESERPPDDVLKERDARYSVYQSLTGRMMGDPPPGFSALDRAGR